MVATMPKRFRSNRKSAIALSLQIAIAGLVSGIVPNANAAEWKIAPTINVAESYTDNVRLSSTKESSFISQFTPGISIIGNGDSLKLHADYHMQNLYYSNVSSGIQTNHQFNSGLNARLIEDLFFLDGSAQISQQNISPFQQTSDNNLNLSANRTEVRTYAISPYFRKNFFNQVIGELRYNYDSVSSSARGLANSTSDTLLLDLKSGPSLQVFNWDAQVRDQKIHFSQISNISLQSETINFGYLLTPHLTINSSLGYENNSYVYIGEKPSGEKWNAGLKWKPSERTQLAFSAGQRFYGNSYTLNAEHRTRATVWGLSYSDDITTSRSQYFFPATSSTSSYLDQLFKASVPDAALRQQVVDRYIQDTGLPSSIASPINTATNRVFLQKNLQASLGLNGARNNMLFSVFRVRRDAQSVSGVDALLLNGGNAALLDNTKQYGASAFWNLKISPLTTLGVNANYTHVRSIKTGIADNNKSLRVFVSKQLLPKLRASMEVRRNEKDSTVNNNNYDENSVLFSVILGL